MFGLVLWTYHHGSPMGEPYATTLMHSFSKLPPYSKNYSIVPVRSKLGADHVENERRSLVSDSLWPHGLYSPWNSPGQNTGVGSLSLLQGTFPTQGSNTGLWHCKWILYQLSHQGTSRILEWVAYPFSSGSSPPRNQTRVSCIAGGFFTNWAIKEAILGLRCFKYIVTHKHTHKYAHSNILPY